MLGFFFSSSHNRLVSFCPYCLAPVQDLVLGTAALGIKSALAVKPDDPGLSLHLVTSGGVALGKLFPQVSISASI